MPQDMGYTAVCIRPEDMANIVLRFQQRNKTFARGRLLIVFVPDGLDNDVASEPSELELNKLHSLGTHLMKSAMAGNKFQAAHIWQERFGKLSEIAIPILASLRKRKTGEWVVGHFLEYNDKTTSSYYEIRPVATLDKAANLICAGFGLLKGIDLSGVEEMSVLPEYPPTRLRKAGLRGLAKSLRARNWSGSNWVAH